jgi:hypothetical protein
MMNAFFVFGLILLLIILFSNFNKNYVINTSYSVKESNILNNNERGLFAEKKYNKGDVIDNCPTIKIKHSDIDTVSRLHDYVFQSYNEEEDVLVAMGYCGMVNHSYEKQNATWEISKDDSTIKLYTIRDVYPGEEFYVNYGDDYWDGRDMNEL